MAGLKRVGNGFLIGLILCAVHFLISGVVRADEQEYRLTRYLMSNYDPAVRPSSNFTQPLNISFGMSLHHIIDVDEKNQILTTNCWITQRWTDFHLRWNATDFSGIKVIRIPVGHVWKPDIILYNNADSQYNSAIINTNVIVESSGEVTWLTHGIYRSSCHINVEYFPFDVQSCYLKFASWTYDGYQVDLLTETDKGDMTNYQPNGEFDLDDVTCVRRVEFYSCCPEPYPDITYTIQLRRRPMFYVFNLILPCILLNGMALLVFYVPSESGEKVTLGVSTLLSMTVFLMVVRESMPPTEKTPLISLYFGVTIIIVSAATGMSVVTLNVHHRGSRGIQVPCLARTLVLGFLAKLMLLKFNNTTNKKESSHCGQHHQYSAPDFQSSYQTTELIDHLEHYKYSPRLSLNRKPFLGNHFSPSLEPSGQGVYGPQEVGGGNPQGPQREMDDFERQFLRVLNRIYETIDKNEARTEEAERREELRVEWQQVATVCDRFLLMIFVAITALATFAILFSSPHGPL